MAERKTCPYCGSFVWRDSVDVGVGIIYGPYGCPQCGWSEDEQYDRRSGINKGQVEFPNHHLDQWGGLTKIKGDEPAEELLANFTKEKDEKDETDE